MNKPNIILISIDTLRADHLSCYGYQRKTTPCIDRIGEKGVVFEKAYTTASWTPPGHGSMLTGLYPSQHGAVGENKLRRSVPTLAEILHNNGYRTAGFINNSQVGELVGLERGHETFYEVWKGIKAKTFVERGARFICRQTIKALHRSDKGADRTVRLVKNWLRENASVKEPFYLFVHFIEPHNPLDPPVGFGSRYLKGIRHAVLNNKRVKDVAENPLICLTDEIVLDHHELQAIIALYDAEIAYTDKKIEKLVDYLKVLKIYDNTLIIITADHGEHFGEHKLYSHVASLYEPVLHVPLIMYYPDVFKKGTRDSHLVQTIDILPTIMEIVNIKGYYNKIEQFGRALVNAGGKDHYHDYIFAEWEGRVPYFVENRIKETDVRPNLDKFKKRITMIREKKFKFISDSYSHEELYDLENDKEEMRDLVLIKKDIVDELRTRIITWKKSISKNDYNDEKQEIIDNKIINNLKALGYM